MSIPKSQKALTNSAKWFIVLSGAPPPLLSALETTSSCLTTTLSASSRMRVTAASRQRSVRTSASENPPIMAPPLANTDALSLSSVAVTPRASRHASSMSSRTAAAFSSPIVSPTAAKISTASPIDLAARTNTCPRLSHGDAVDDDDGGSCRWREPPEERWRSGDLRDAGPVDVRPVGAGCGGLGDGGDTSPALSSRSSMATGHGFFRRGGDMIAAAAPGGLQPPTK